MRSSSRLTLFVAILAPVVALADPAPDDGLIVGSDYTAADTPVPAYVRFNSEYST